MKPNIITASMEDKIKLIRLNVKTLSMLEEADSLEYLVKEKKSKYIKYKVKKPFLLYIAFADKFNRIFMEALGLKEPEKTTELVKMFNDASKKIDLISEEKTEFVLLYVKVASILYDLQGMEYTDRTIEYFKELSSELLIAMREQFPNVFDITDPEGYGVKDLIASFNRLGDNILYTDKKEEDEKGN